ncbi:hypothetical protein [Pseudonocardia phyllosphaerae]|uniref:hypothetical protein n=1 Tax=Pseudonocardia phyllosphaerae TaxID=3390502 RepID=UPI00397A11F8
MIVPQLRQTAQAHRPGPVRVHFGPLGPRLLLRALLVVLALATLVMILTGCGGAQQLPPADAAASGAAPPPAAQPPAPPAAAAPPSATDNPSTTDEPATDEPEPTTGSAPSTTDDESGDSGESGTTPPSGEARRAAPTTTPAPSHAHGSAGNAGSVDSGTAGEGTQEKKKERSAPSSATPIWPASSQAQAKALQQRVDNGGEPWLLDPREVAISYAGSELGYRNPKVTVRRPGVVDLHDGNGSSASVTVTLSQTVRKGAGGIWLVTGVAKH